MVNSVSNAWIAPVGAWIVFDVNWKQSFRELQAKGLRYWIITTTRCSATQFMHQRCDSWHSQFTPQAIHFNALLSLEAIATGTAFRVTTTRIAYVDFTERAVIPCAVVLTFRNAAANTCVHFLYVFIHHNKKNLLFSKNSMGKVAKDYWHF